MIEYDLWNPWKLSHYNFLMVPQLLWFVALSTDTNYKFRISPDTYCPSSPCHSLVMTKGVVSKSDIVHATLPTQKTHSLKLHLCHLCWNSRVIFNHILKIWKIYWIWFHYMFPTQEFSKNIKPFWKLFHIGIII